MAEKTAALKNVHTISPGSVPQKKVKREWIFGDFKKNWQLYVMMVIPVAFILVFAYYPMYGAQIAFRDFIATEGIWGSPWVGLKHFDRFIHTYQFWLLLKNTLAISVYSLFAELPVPILLALGLNYVKNQHFKKTVQMVTYLPHFISVVVMVGMITQIFNNQTGVVNNLVQLLTGEKVNFLGDPKYFRSLYVWTNVWQGAGWGSILYISALSGVDPQLHEAAIMDGASLVKRIWHIDLPCILPTIMITLIMNCGRILSVSFNKIFLMQNPTNLEVSEVISTYVYKTGIAAPLANYSYPTAIGLFTSVISFLLVFTVNKISKKLTSTGLW